MLNDPTCKKQRIKYISQLGRKSGKNDGLQANSKMEMEYNVIPVQDATTIDSNLQGGLDNQDNLLPPNWLPGPKGSNYNILEPGLKDNAPPPDLQYNKDLRIWVEYYPVETVGASFRRATREEMAKWVWGEPGDIGKLADPDNFEMAEFALEAGLSVKD
ncbi:hypothetical protein RhiXN_09343 [Rhizoctonia solani]|uniref:Uncharacterized protein n=1 Tax=Rhizoctonia solani TaxID=456999 RepID=A0A8H8SXJ5_9AGAM|nr:uncharacterized protein RhiXN_09343 [Rhizoctonia solani]QRW20368.1 hypothetical protein RhiXN_09343 [Rhizoctonia solani]